MLCWVAFLIRNEKCVKALLIYDSLRFKYTKLMMMILFSLIFLSDQKNYPEWECNFIAIIIAQIGGRDRYSFILPKICSSFGVDFETRKCNNFCPLLKSPSLLQSNVIHGTLIYWADQVLYSQSVWKKYEIN